MIIIIKEINRGAIILGHAWQYQRITCVTVLIIIGCMYQKSFSRSCVNLVHPAVYEEIRPDIAYIRPDIIHIRPDVGCHLWNIM